MSHGKIEKILKYIFNTMRALRNKARISYAQCGEDLIIDFIFRCLKISKPTYLDIGAHHPTLLSNTYLFYSQGGRGVLVEADPLLHKTIARVRKKDKCLNLGVGIDARDSAKFYVMTARTLNTFSKEEAERYASYGAQKIEQILDIPLVPVNQILRENFGTPPNLLSIDVEGLDFEILKTYDFDHYAPEIICVETITYTEDASEQKLPEIKELVSSKGYFLYADTYINSIFVRKSSWDNRLQ